MQEQSAKNGGETRYRNEEFEDRGVTMLTHGLSLDERQKAVVEKFRRLETAVHGLCYIVEEVGSKIDDETNTIAGGPCAWEAGRLLSESLKKRFDALLDAWIESAKGGAR